jgi:hypothetical protein
MILLYLDPGTGTVIIQIIIAGLASLVVYFKQLRIFLFDFIRRIFKKKRD